MQGRERSFLKSNPPNLTMSSSSSIPSQFVLQNLLSLQISLFEIKRQHDTDSEEKIAERAEALRERILLERRAERRKERVLKIKSLLRDVEEGVDIFALIHNPHEASLASPPPPNLFEVSLPSVDQPQAEEIGRQGSESFL